MAQLHFTLNQEEILQLLEKDKDSAFAELLENCLNTLLKAESAAQLHAEPYERTEERTASRNGFRDRALDTRIGSITLHVPKHRGGEPFKTLIFDNYCRSEAALIVAMAEMVVNGVSTRKVSNVMETLCGKSYSKSTVSEACKKLDEEVSTFRDRQLSGEYPFLTVDATYFKVRENGRIISKALMIGLATNTEGRREIVGFGIYENESKSTWNAFLKGLKSRGLSGVKMITSDAHEGIVDAVANVFPGAAWQRCQFHFSRNIIDKTPKKYQAGLAGELQEMFNCSSLEEARKVKDDLYREYEDVAPEAAKCLDDGFESSMSVMVLPPYLRKYFRTSNQIERLNKELKRRSKVIGIFPNENSLMRLIGSVLQEQHDILQSRKCIFSAVSLQGILTPALISSLIQIATEQQKLLKT